MYFIGAREVFQWVKLETQAFLHLEKLTLTQLHLDQTDLLKITE